jgi:hypothetical protein
MNRQIRILAAAAVLLVAGSGEAAAQFTGVVTPPRPTPRQQAAVARADSASRNTGARDSANTTRLTDMKTWVDSATVALAGTDARPRADTTTARDTVAAEVTVAGPVAGRRGANAPAPAMHDGARAPDTATPLPTLALLGALAVGVGVVLMGRDRRRA